MSITFHFEYCGFFRFPIILIISQKPFLFKKKISLNWIERLTTNQKAGSSNLSGRTR